MAYIRGNDTIRGTDVTFYLEIQKENGDYEQLEFMHAKNWETTVEFNKDDVPRIGTRVVGKKNGTLTYSGSCTLYYMDPTLRQVFLNFVNTGLWPSISACVINYDKDSRAQYQVAVHRGIKFDSMVISKFDAESTSLEEDMDFTFEEVSIPEQFKRFEGETEEQQYSDHFDQLYPGVIDNLKDQYGQ